MQVVDNRTELEGTIRSREPHPQLPDFDLVRLKVEKAAPVEGKTDLLSAIVGQEVPLTVRRALLDDAAQPGAKLLCRAKRTPDGAIADTYPEPGTFTVHRGGPELEPRSSR